MSHALAERARQIASAVENLSNHIVQSFATDDASERVRALQQTTTEILVDVAPVLNWLEVRISGAYEQLLRRLHLVSSEAVACAESIIPEYSGGKRVGVLPGAEPSLGVQRAATLAITAKLTANSIRAIAHLVEEQSPVAEIAARSAKWHKQHGNPPAEFSHGPLTGPKKKLAAWIRPNAKDDEGRWLDTAVRDGLYWGRREARNRWSVWFKTPEQYAQANARRLAEPQ